MVEKNCGGMMTWLLQLESPDKKVRIEAEENLSQIESVTLISFLLEVIGSTCDDTNDARDFEMT